jgi:A/G-specific adenine glycosylase
VTRPERTFAARLLAWFDRDGRHDLPWQHDRSPYRVWVSEVMLQQTQVATVIPYFERFMARFPTVSALAEAPPDAVLHHWSGLGYYARARHLHRAAQTLVAEHGGRLPEDVDTLQSLPGIGRSTAGAILAQALDQRHPILDGNVKRVLTRWAGIEGFPGEARVAARLWALSDALTPAVRARDYTQAIMDLGATRCTRSRPACGRCPVSEDCVARRDGRQAELPQKRVPRARPTRVVYWLVIRRGDAVLLVRRPPSGIWGGLYGFPEAPDENDLRAVAEARCPGTSPDCQSLAEIPHAFSHFDLIIRPRLCLGLATVERPGETWYNVADPVVLGLPAPVAALIARLRGDGPRALS